MLLMGAPDWQACASLARGLVERFEPCSAPPCPSDMPKLPNVRGGNWGGASGDADPAYTEKC